MLEIKNTTFLFGKTAVHVGDLCDIRHDEWISYWVTVGLGIVNFPMVRVNAKVTIRRTCSFLIEIKNHIKIVNFYGKFIFNYPA